VKHPQLQDVSVVELLEALQRSINNTHIKLPKVLVPINKQYLVEKK
jgi:hypothetical protein